MLEGLHGLIISTAYATTAEEFATQLSTDFYDTFWAPFGVWALAALVISVAIMVWRRFRGMARRPK